MPIYVYTHHKATTGEIFYVGIGHRYRPRSKTARNSHWLNVVEKHGCVVNIVGEFDSRADAAAMECWLIGAWRDAGVDLTNKTSGGTEDFQFCDETRAAMSASLLAVCKQPSTIAKKAATMATDAYRMRMSSAVTAARSRPEVRAKHAEWLASDSFKSMAATRNAIPIVRSDGKRYISTNAAAREMGVTDAAILSVLNRKTHSCKGYGWRREGDAEAPPAAVKPGRHLPVIRSDGVAFESLLSAAESVGSKPTSIRYAIDAGSVHAGFTWASPVARTKFGKDGAIAVIRGDGVRFESARHAAESCGVSRDMIHRAVAGKAKTAGGHTWTRAS